MVACSPARAARFAVTLVVVALGGVLGPNAWVARASRGHAFAAASAVPRRSVAIVPGSRVYRGRPLAIVEARLQAALTLYQAGQVKAILVSGQDSAAAPEATVMRAWLEARGVPAARVWSDGGGTRTRETMNRAAALFGVTDAVVCTQTLNMPRALFLAEAAGIDAVGLELATSLARSPRFVGVEAMKTTLAFAEAYTRERPLPAAAPLALAAR